MQRARALALPPLMSTVALLNVSSEPPWPAANAAGVVVSVAAASAPAATTPREQVALGLEHGVLHSVFGGFRSEGRSRHATRGGAGDQRSTPRRSRWAPERGVQGQVRRRRRRRPLTRTVGPFRCAPQRQCGPGTGEALLKNGTVPFSLFCAGWRAQKKGTTDATQRSRARRKDDAVPVQLHRGIPPVVEEESQQASRRGASPVRKPPSQAMPHSQYGPPTVAS